jgi:GNAT superfamily N-acetyltransferase
VTAQPPPRHPVVIRPATIADAAGIATVHVRAWRAAYCGLVPQSFLDGLDPRCRQERWERLLAVVGWPATGTLVATPSPSGAGTPLAAQPPNGDTHGLLGFACICPSRDEDGAGTGELASIYVDPGAWRQGIGRSLLGAAVIALARAGFGRATLWVLDGNQRARSFYCARGWTADGASRQATIGGAALSEVRYQRPLPTLA